MKTIDFSYFIERFNAGEMDDAEKKWFLKELEGNEKLRREVDLRKKTDDFLNKREIFTLREKLAAIEKNRETVRAEKEPRRPVKIKYAALIVILAIAGGISLIPGKKLSSEEIMNRYYSAYETTATSRSYTAEADPDYLMAMDYYKIHDYRKAAIYFSKVLENNPKDMESTLLQGVSNFEISNYPESKQLFTSVIDNNNNLFVEDARWYLALCYIRTDEEMKAIDQLQEIKKSSSIYKRDAKNILRKIK
jgi:tetratricopeptide (TPR) repeat protein